VAAAVDLLEAARLVDDPHERPYLPEVYGPRLRHGWDSHPGEHQLLVPDGERSPVGLLVVDLPVRDNRHLVWTEVVVHPDHRRRGLGSQLLAEALRRTRDAGRTTVWAGGPADAPGTSGFLEHHGFHHASSDARRRQVLAEVDMVAVERLRQEALAAAGDYELERLTAPHPEELLAEMTVVVDAINDAPMGDLSFEREVFDVDRLRAIEAARVGRGDQQHRVVARHRGTGELAGHTVVEVHPAQPRWGAQGDTAVAAAHRGHRLGLLLKIEMLRWLAEVEPQLDEVETWNQTDNHPMIRVNEMLGYRLDRTFAMYELVLAAQPASA